MKSSTRFLFLCLAGLIGGLGLVAWHLAARDAPSLPPKAAAVPASRAAPVPVDPEAGIRTVIESLRRLPPAQYTGALPATLEALGRQDPDRALALARALVTTHEQRAFYNSLFARLAADDPLAAVPRLALVPPGDSRDRALRALADGWAARDLPAALAWAQQLAAADRPPAMEAVLMAMASIDPPQAMAIARQTLTGAALDRTVTAALQSMVGTDPTTAGAVVSTLAPGEVQTRAALDVARALAGQDPAGALTWARTLSSGQARELALGNVVEVWAASHPQEAGTYVAALPDGALQETAAMRVARVWAAGDAAGAIAWAQALESDSARHQALTHAASVWAQHDPAAAAQWAATTPAAPAEALAGALSHWMQQDAEAVKIFVHALTGESQLHAATSVAPALAQQDPRATLAWTQTLTEPAARESALTAAYARWQLNAPGAAREWLATADLPAATKTRLLAGP